MKHIVRNLNTPDGFLAGPLSTTPLVDVSGLLATTPPSRRFVVGLGGDAPVIGATRWTPGVKTNTVSLFDTVDIEVNFAPALIGRILTNIRVKTGEGAELVGYSNRGPLIVAVVRLKRLGDNVVSFYCETESTSITRSIVVPVGEK